MELSIEKVDLLHKGKNNLIQRSISVLGIEVQTRCVTQQKQLSDCSLIRPWSVTATMEGCNCGSECPCKLHLYCISADTLQARAAFSDMTVALDTGMHFVRDVHEANRMSTILQPSPSNATNLREDPESTNGIIFPRKRCFRFKWEGFRLTIADDSGRHFAGNQDLIVFLVCGINFLRDEAVAGRHQGSRAPFQYKMSVRIQSLDLLDCLQSNSSPFRDLLRVRSAPAGFSVAKNGGDTLLGTYPHPPTIDKVHSAHSGVSDSPDSSPAVEIWSDVKESRVYGVDLRSFEVQYNPSVVVALQRFMGRLIKEAKKRHADILERPKTAESIQSKYTGSGDEKAQRVATCGSVDIRFLSLCLNKEHQGRRLLEVVISHSHMKLECHEASTCISGHIRSMEAIDPAGKQKGFVAKVVRSTLTAEHFIAFKYKTFAKPIVVAESEIQDVPVWIVKHLDATRAIDDFLDISVSSVEAVFVRDRTEEILDYLSNGMPGKGMGATSRVAKGFVKDRIQKRSFLNVQIESASFFIPQDRFCDSSMSFCFGACISCTVVCASHSP